MLMGSTRRALAIVTAAAGSCRLCNPVELETILLAPAPCRTNPCIDPTFGPTAASVYLSATTIARSPDFAWAVNFNNGAVTDDIKLFGFLSARAVRTGP